MSEASPRGQNVVPLPVRRRPQLQQVVLGFPMGEAAQYRWLFKDGTTSAWQTAGNRLFRAPPFAYGCEWRATP